MATDSPVLKRVKRKIKKCQNPLFEKWLKEWKDEANRNGSEMQYCFNRALKSLQKFPFQLKTGKECIMLENFGSKICQMLDKKLEEHKALHQSDASPQYNQISLKDVTKQIHGAKKRKSTDELPESKKLAESQSDANIPFHNGNDINYRPSNGSGAYAILRTLYEKSQEEKFKGYLTKSEIQNYAQKYCDSSFTTPKPGSHYTAWSSMAILIQKELVVKSGNPAKYSLSEKGQCTASELKLINNQEAHNIKTVSINKNNPKVQKKKIVEIEDNTSLLENKVCQNKNPTQTNKPSSNEILSQLPQEVQITECSEDFNEPIFMLPNTFKIILLVDNQERDNKFQQSDQMTVRHLKTKNVDFEIRHLKVGDFIWIARNEKGQELVLPYIVERKRMDDLASSIKDGRFHEQKFRLKQSGVENLIYLVEKFGTENQRLGLPLPTLQQAISNTQIVGRFTVRITNDHNHSMRYLTILTTQLNNIFRGKTLMNCKKSDITPVNLSDDLISLMTFKDFNKGSEKNKKPTIRNMLVKHLLQLNGLSVEKAKAIVQLYPTPKILMKALRETDGEKNICKLTYGSFNRSIGPVTAKQIKLLYTSMVLN